MKVCPTCGTRYTDDTLSFCLTDGANLREHTSEHKTEVMPGSDLSLETDDALARETNEQSVSTIEPKPLSQHVDSQRGVSPFWVGATFMLLGVVIGGGLIGWLVYNRTERGVNSNRNVAVNANGESTKSTPEYRVSGVKSNDVLYIRPAPGNLKTIVGKIPPDGSGIVITGPSKKLKKSTWVPIEYKGIRGWVNRGFLVKTSN